MNLAGGRYATLTVAMVLPHHEGTAEAGGENAVEPPEGFGAMPQEALVRAAVTDTVSGSDAARLLKRSGRKRLQKQILSRLKKTTDINAEDILLTDVAVQ